MQKIFLAAVIFITASFNGFSQVTVDTTINLDLLKSPSSPAFNILGIAQSDIERPTDLGSFALSVQNATKNFTVIPNSYAFQVAPFLMGKRKYSLNEFDDNKNAFKQSFLISAGYTYMGPKGKEDIDSLKTTKIGFGLKFSIIRPKWSTATRASYQTLVAEQKALLQAYRAFETSHVKNKELQAKKKQLQKLEAKDVLTEQEKKQRADLLQAIAALTEEIGDDAEQNTPSFEGYEKAKEAALAFKTERQGFFLDFSGGAALDFPDNRLNNSSVYRAGMWLTGGHENGNKGFSSLFILRYLYHPETIFADPAGLLKGGGDVSTFDMGGKILLDVAKDRFSLNTEAIYRSILGNSLVKPSWRLVLNAEYDLTANRKITFAFGRDFDGTISKGGNLIAAINLIAAFGTNRKIADK